MAITVKNHGLPLDADGRPIQVAARIQTKDGTGTPQNSPLAVSSAVKTLVVPEDAIVLWLKPSAALKVSELVGMSPYFTFATDVWASLPVAGLTAVYVVRAAGDLTLDFYFECVGRGN